MQEIFGVDTMADFVREGAQAQGLQNFPSCIAVSHSSPHYTMIFVYFLNSYENIRKIISSPLFMVFF